MIGCDMFHVGCADKSIIVLDLIHDHHKNRDRAEARLADPLYVVKLDPERKEVVVGPKSMLATRKIPVREINWLGDAPLTSQAEWNIAVRVRSTRPPRDAILRPISETEAEVELLTAEEGVSPGQACVFYDPESTRIFGGGWIHRG